MLHRHWVLLLKQVARQIGCGDAVLTSFTFNSMRRFMPTLASVLRVSAETAQAIGHWQDTPFGEGGASAGLRMMSVHYSDQKALASAQAKRQVLQEFFGLLSSHPAAAAALSGTAQMPRGSLTWEHVATLHHQHTTTSASPPAPLPLRQVPRRSPTPPVLLHARHVKKEKKAKKAKKEKKGKKEKKRQREEGQPQHHAAHSGDAGKRSRPSRGRPLASESLQA